MWHLDWSLGLMGMTTHKIHLKNVGALVIYMHLLSNVIAIVFVVIILCSVHRAQNK